MNVVKMKMKKELLAPNAVMDITYILIQIHKVNHVHHAVKIVSLAQKQHAQNAMKDFMLIQKDNVANVKHHAYNVQEMMDQHVQNALMVIMHQMVNAKNVNLHVFHAVDLQQTVFRALMEHILMEIIVILAKITVMNALVLQLVQSVQLDIFYQVEHVLNVMIPA